MESKFPIPNAVFILDVDPRVGVYRIACLRGEKPNHFADLVGLAAAREVFQSCSQLNIFQIDGAYEQVPHLMQA
jgi:hypothetical protein